MFRTFTKILRLNCLHEPVLSYPALFTQTIEYLYMYLKVVIFEIIEVNVPLA